MKRIIWLMVVVAGLMLWVGCAEEEVPKTEEEYVGGDMGQGFDEMWNTMMEGETDEEGSNITDDPEYMGGSLVATETFVGHGINVFSGPTYIEAKKPALFRDNVYKNASAYIESFTVNDANFHSDVSDRVSELYSNFSIDANISTGSMVPFFSGSVSSQYSKSSSLKSTAMYYKYEYRQELDGHNVKSSYSDPNNMRGLLTDAVKKNLNDANYKPADLFKYYGTHIIVKASTGGQATITGEYNGDESVTKEDFKLAVSFKSSYVNGEFKVGTSDKVKAAASKTCIKVNSKGGSTGGWGSIAITELGESLDTWGQSVDNKTATLARIYDLVPIWHLVDGGETSDRAVKVEQAFYSLVGGTNKNLLEGYSVTPPQIENGKTYVFRNALSGYDIHVEGPSKDNGAVLHLWKDDEHPSQARWKAIASNKHTGCYRFKNEYSGKYMDKTNDFNKQLYQWDESEGKGEDNCNQQFYPVLNDDKTFSFFNGCPNGDKYLISGEGTKHDKGTRIIMSSSGGAERTWNLFLKN